MHPVLIELVLNINTYDYVLRLHLSFPGNFPATSRNSKLSPAVDDRLIRKF